MLALLVSFVAYELSFVRAMTVGGAALGAWGIAAAIALGFGIAVVFTAIYDGPVDRVEAITGPVGVAISGC